MQCTAAVVVVVVGYAALGLGRMIEAKQEKRIPHLGPTRCGNF